jgi:hypothetical protein
MVSPADFIFKFTEQKRKPCDEAIEFLQTKNMMADAWETCKIHTGCFGFYTMFSILTIPKCVSLLCGLVAEVLKINLLYV